MEKKKIAIVTSSPRTVLSFLQTHIKYLSMYFDVYILTNINGANEKENLKIFIDENALENIKEFATIIQVGITRRISLIIDIKTIFILSEIFKKKEFFSVHSITSKVGILTMISAFLVGTNHRFHTYTGQVWVNMYGVKRFFFRFMDKLIGTLCTSCYADSKSQMIYLINEKIVNEKKISVMGEGSISGVDLSRFFPDKNKREKVRRNLFIPQNDIVFVLLCRLTRDKGVLDLARAFSLIVKNLNCTLLIVGPDEDNLISEIKFLVGSDFASKLIFHGFTEHHEDFLNASDVLCLPSYREGFGTVIIDAAAIGIPSIGSDIYGIQDAIVNGITGILHKPGNIAEIHDAMYKLSSDEVLRTKMGQNAFLRVQNKFTMEEISQAWLNEYIERLKAD